MSKNPKTIGKYKVESRIAQGGMGAVYLGTHPTLDRKVILKKLTLRGSSSIVERFKREARIMMDFKSDFIVDVYDHFKEGSSYYIVLEYIDGTSLDNLIKKYKRIPNNVALYIILGTAKALQYAHNKNVIHRDIKPANILISKTGHVKLVDFGIAVSQDEEEGLTIEGTTLGTPSYMAPEQLANSKGVDNRADIYSLGVMFYEMVTGKKPFQGYVTAELIAAIQTGKCKRPRKLNPKITPFMQRLIIKMMKTKPRRRLQDLNGLIDKLNKKLKREKPAKLKEYLIALVQDKDWKKFEIKRRFPIFRTLVKATGILIILVGLAFASVKTGIYQRVFAPKSSGTFSFNLQYDTGDLLEGSYPVQIVLEYSKILTDEEKTEQAALEGEAAEPKNKIYTINTSVKNSEEALEKIIRFYGKTGLYKVTVNFLTFNMYYELEMKSFKDAPEGLAVPIHISEKSYNSIYVGFALADAETGEDLTDYAILKFQNPRNKNWVEPNTLSVKPGNKYKASIYTDSGEVKLKYQSGVFNVEIPKDVDKFIIYKALTKQE